MNYKTLYIELGKLLYAIAKSDGVIQAQERAVVKDFVKQQLTPLESSIDKFGSDQAFYAEFEFDLLESENASYSDAFASFKQYLHQHEKLFNDQLIKLVFDAVKAVASAYKGTNKNELLIIEELNKEFKKIKTNAIA